MPFDNIRANALKLQSQPKHGISGDFETKKKKIKKINKKNNKKLKKNYFKK